MLDKAIFDQSDELVGWAGELLVEVSEGRVEYVRVALADGAARTDRMVVVPWSVLCSDAEFDGKWRINARKSLLESLASRQSKLKSEYQA